MKQRLWWVVGMLALLAAVGAGSNPAAAQSNAHIFPETGFTVRDLFWQYWQAHGGLPVFGYPISGEFTAVSDLDGKPYTMQYFERAVFELHPTNLAPYNVLLAQLGTFHYRQKYPSGAPGQQPAAGGQLFPETGHQVGGRFLAYWQTHGGLPILGYPISDEFTERSDLNGQPYTVQYFERAVFEYHPENRAPYDVLLTQLGTLQSRQRYPSGAPTPPAAGAPGPAPLAGDWPMYGHDAARTNDNPDETTISAANAGSLVSRWQADVGLGRTASSGAPSVANGRVYVGSSVAGGPNFFAFDAQTGARLWQADLGYEDACFHVGIGATAAITGGVVIAGGGDGAYYGLNAATGAQIWRDATDQQASNFAWASPLPVGDRVIYGLASYCDKTQVRGEVRAVGAVDGVLRGVQYLVPAGQQGASLWNSPALSPDGQTLLLATGEERGAASGPDTRALVALDPTTFAIQAANQQGSPGADEDWGSTPLVFHDAAGRTLVGAGHKDGHFYAYRRDAINAGPLWQQPYATQIGLMAAYDPSTRPGGTLFMPTTHQFLHAVDPATGADLWPATNIGDARGNIALANGLIFVNAANKGVLVLDAHTGALLRTLVPDHPGATNSGVVVAHGFVYWLSGAYLNAWSLPATNP